MSNTIALPGPARPARPARPRRGLRSPRALPSLLAALALSALAALSAACGSGSASDGDSAASGGAAGPSSPGGPVGVGQAGAQDFGLFRQILERGEIPGPETLDDRGFFAEHKLDLPAPDCGDDVCMHASLGLMSNLISGSPCTLLEIGMSSPIDVQSLPRPPLDLVVVVDTSGSMQGSPIAHVRTGLTTMLGALHEGDAVSLVSFSDKAHVLAEGVAASDHDALVGAIEQLVAKGSTNLFDGLFTGLSLAQAHHAKGAQSRVIFLSDGEATTGIESAAKLRSLAEGYAKQGISISTIGVGKDFDVGVMRGLGEVGAGNFYFLEDSAAVEQVFASEVKTFLFPVALDAHIDVAVNQAFSVRGVFGTRGWDGGSAGGSVDIPALFLAGRESADEPVEGGRRGGGGAIMLELLPAGSPSAAGGEVGTVSFSWQRPDTGETVQQTVDISSPYGALSAPEGGYFSEATSEKAFVMLNVFAGLRAAARQAADGDPRTARVTLEALRASGSHWLALHPDPDIEDDLKYVDLFIKNLRTREQSSTINTLPDPPVVDPWPYD